MPKTTHTHIKCTVPPVLEPSKQLALFMYFATDEFRHYSIPSVRSCAKTWFYSVRLSLSGGCGSECYPTTWCHNSRRVQPHCPSHTYTIIVGKEPRVDPPKHWCKECFQLNKIPSAESSSLGLPWYLPSYACGSNVFFLYSSLVFHQGSKSLIISSEEGIHQGDPLGPVLFSQESNHYWVYVARP